MLSGNAAAAATRATIPVLTRYGAWRVPYAFAVVHGVRSDIVAAAAIRYDFERVTV